MPQLDQLELFPQVSSSARSPSSLAEQTTPEAALNAMPDYAVRESARAKHVSIKISVEGEVEVVVPADFDRKQLPDILKRRRAWIIKTRSRLMQDAKDTPKDWQVTKPESILFRWRSTQLEDPAPTKGFQPVADPKLESWSVSYQPGSGKKTLCIPAANNTLTLKGNTEQLSACQAVLRKWLAHRAQRDLVPWLRQLGYDIKLPCRRISVRGQKTRWASCSSQKDISLNYKLLFLPRPLVHYVLVHELCHTVHMNHSKQFWSLVEDKMPNYAQWDSRLKQAWRYVPRWVEKK